MPDTNSKCILCRREKTKLFLKGDRCLSEKCAFTKRDYPPGQHGKKRNPKVSDYGLQLREKQKVRRMYGIREQQFRNYFSKAEQQKGITGMNLLRLLETRLDNVVYRLGLAPSRRAARVLVNQRHFTLNQRTVNIPSYSVRIGDVVQVRDKSRKLSMIHDSLKKMSENRLVPWLELDKVNLRGTVKADVKREDIASPIQENLIVELYSK